MQPWLHVFPSLLQTSAPHRSVLAKQEAETTGTGHRVHTSYSFARGALEAFAQMWLAETTVTDLVLVKMVNVGRRAHLQASRSIGEASKH